MFLQILLSWEITRPERLTAYHPPPPPSPEEPEPLLPEIVPGAETRIISTTVIVESGWMVISLSKFRIFSEPSLAKEFIEIAR